VLPTRPLRPTPHQGRGQCQPHARPSHACVFMLCYEPRNGQNNHGRDVHKARVLDVVWCQAIAVIISYRPTSWKKGKRASAPLLRDRSGQQHPEVARDPRDLDPRVSRMVVSVDLNTYNPDVRRKISGPAASWSLSVLRRGHRIDSHVTVSRRCARKLANRAQPPAAAHGPTPTSGQEHYFPSDHA